ncbi:MAG: hypothetical protein AB7F78_24485 [Hyphomicrobiaceae bacterium]
MRFNFSRLREELAERYTTRGMRVHADGHTIATMEPPWLGFGLITIDDDDDEITVYCGVFTHVHFGDYSEGSDPSARAIRISADVIAFLDAVFSDQIEFWKCRRAGGCGPRGEQDKPHWCGTNRLYKRGVWSGPLE